MLTENEASSGNDIEKNSMSRYINAQEKSFQMQSVKVYHTCE